MADNTPIEWADATVNAINGCSLASPGCTNCYAMKQAHRVKIRRGLTQPGKGGMVWTGEVRFAEDQLLKPLAWKRPRRIFWNAHGDTFHPAVPDEWIDQVVATAAATPQHIHMILTKRSDRMRDYFTRLPERIDAWNCNAGLDFVDLPLANLWLGVSVEDQSRADERIPDLLATPAAKRFISAEPLLGPIDLTRIMEAGAEECFHDVKLEPISFEGRTCTEGRSSLNALTGHYWGEDLIDGQWEGWVDYHQSPGFGEPGYHKPLDWVIVGGENGPRPMHRDWVRSMRDQCASAGVAFHFKQWGTFWPTEAVPNDSGGVDFVPPIPIDASIMRLRKWEGNETRAARRDESVGEFFEPGHFAVPLGKKAAGRLLDGVEHNGMPA